MFGNCSWIIIIILLLLVCCGGGNFFGCGTPFAGDGCGGPCGC